MIPTRIAVDIGGTFTDLIITDSKETKIHKVLTKNMAPDEGVKLAIDLIPTEVNPQQFLHSSTIVTNMIIEHKGSKTAFLTSHGMRDVLHIGRHKRPLNYAIAQIIPWQHFPPVPKKWRIALNERIDKDGRVIHPLNEQELKDAVKKLIAEGVTSIAIGFLHSYKFPFHEQEAKRLIQEMAPHITLSLSSEVSPRFREYERFMTTALNARVKPAVQTYLTRINDMLQKKWQGLNATVISSNGGLEEIHSEMGTNMGENEGNTILNVPIRLALSGPAAAGNAVAAISRDLNIANCVGLDVGGTSADIIIIKNHHLHESPQEERQVAGFPLQIPMLDLYTLGAGGGSIIYQDEMGELHVGPQSAGSNPGPACYGFGGEQPALTDAALLVGRLPGTTLLADYLPLQKQLAEKAFAKNFPNHNSDNNNGDEMIPIALAALKLAEANIAFAIRAQTVARGINPKEISLIIAGGAGGLLACGIADVVEISEIIIPTNPGLLAAWGLLVSPLQYENTLSVLQNLEDLSDDDISALLLKTTSEGPKNVLINARLCYVASLRYHGQGFEVEIELKQEQKEGQQRQDNSSPLTKNKIAEIFHEAHLREYGFQSKSSSIEWIELRARWSSPAPKQSPNYLQNETQKENLKRNTRTTSVYFECDSMTIEKQVPYFERKNLPTGYTQDGPAIIGETSSTTFVAENWMFEVLTNGYLKLSLKK